MTTSQGIFDWMEENKDFFKPQGICKRVGIDKSNFSKYKKEKKIPEKYLQPIMELIMPLGFTLDKVIKENNKPENKERILKERNTVSDSVFSDLAKSSQPIPENETVADIPKEESIVEKMLRENREKFSKQYKTK